jgi:hypothetical protein
MAAIEHMEGTCLDDNGIARLAGASYALVIILGMVCMGHIDGYATGVAAETAESIRANAQLIRWAFVGELTMYLLVVVLSVSLYVLLRRIDPHLALMAALFRCAEAIVGATLAVVATAIPLELVAGGNAGVLVEQLIGVGTAGIDVVLLFMAAGGTLFFVLLFRSSLVPKWLSVWGLATYVSMAAVALGGLLVPELDEATKMLVYAPGGVFELVFGIWLAIRGVDHRRTTTDYSS